MKVCEAMTTTVQLCTPDDTLRNAAEAMAALGVGLLPVTDNERLVGMISDRDIAIRGIGMSRGPDSRVGDVMTADVKYCFEDQDLDASPVVAREPRRGDLLQVRGKSLQGRRRRGKLDGGVGQGGGPDGGHNSPAGILGRRRRRPGRDGNAVDGGGIRGLVVARF